MVMATIKQWTNHPDKILSLLSRSLVERHLYKVRLQAEPVDEKIVIDKKNELVQKLGIKEEDTEYFVFTGEASNTTYDFRDEHIRILFKDGSVKDISEVDNALIHRELSATVKKHYFCYYRT
jgi:uncharacterized protein